MLGIDWAGLFVPSGSLAEIVVRGTVIYLVLFVAMRLLPRREIGGMGAADILVVVLIADAVQNGMSGEYRSVTEGVLLAAVIFGWASLIDWLDYRFPHWHLAEAKEIPLIRNGQLLRRNMARDHITEEEILAQLRMHGIEGTEDVAAAYLEGDGRLSVILRGKRQHLAPPPSSRGLPG